MRSHRLAISIATLLVTGPLGAQQVPAAYPVARTVDTVTTYFGAAVPDPYRWMESLDSPDVGEWVRAENAVTMPYLAALPGRVPSPPASPRSTTTHARACRSGKAVAGSTPATPGSSARTCSTRGRRIDGPEQVVLDPNKLSPDGSVPLTSFARRPMDGGSPAGQSEGGSDWAVLYTRDLRDRTELGGHHAVGEVQRSFLDP